MELLLRREFTVEVSAEEAWRHLAQVEKWPSWAKHIRSVRMTPPGELTPTSSGEFRLSNGVRATFRVTEYRKPESWRWVGPFLWLTVDYDHRFEPLGPRRTRLVWTVSGEGFGLGRLFAAIYARNLDRAIPRLVAELSPP